MLLSIDWRASVAYRHAKTIHAAGFAWEYLRRDEDYHHDFCAISRMKNPAGSRLDAFARRWGLRFPLRS
ncbi:MAG: DUF6499 domain-containing protein [Xanthobacter sp.]